MSHATITLPGDKAADILGRAIAELEDKDSPLSRRLALIGAEQLPLPGIADEIEGVQMRIVRDYFARFLALEETMDIYREQLNELWQEVKERSLPTKTMRSALKIARAQHKRDASKAVLNACVLVALSLMPPDEDDERQGQPRPEAVDMTTGEVRDSART